MSDCARIATESLAKVASGSYIKERFCDIINPPPVDGRTEEEKFYDIIHGMGLEVTDG